MQSLPFLAEQSDQLLSVLTPAKLKVFHEQVSEVVVQLQEAFDGGYRVYVAGNGGSAAEAQHLSDEMVGRYKEDRPAYPVVALTCDGAVLTCIGNDYGYDKVFSRQLLALGKEGDVFVALSTSGNSPNIVHACATAKDLGMTIIGFTGMSGKLNEVADYAITIDSQHAARIQEMHLHAIHLICTAFEPNNISIS
jgi:D-sedoheptulose 7-phosphate isomerase